MRPLAVGIHTALLQSAPDTIPKIRIRRFLQAYCKNAKYKKLLVNGTIRVNLDGSEHSKVTKEQVPQKKQYKQVTYRAPIFSLEDLESKYSYLSQV